MLAANQQTSRGLPAEWHPAKANLHQRLVRAPALCWRENRAMTGCFSLPEMLCTRRITRRRHALVITRYRIYVIVDGKQVALVAPIVCLWCALRDSVAQRFDECN